MSVLSPTQLDQLARKLKEDYQALVREVREELENSGNQHRIDLLNREPGDSGDESLANALADFNLALLDRHIDGMRDIEAALQRIRNGEYGVCIDCGDAVTFPRLMAYPTAKRCIVCQEQREKLYAQEGRPKM
ncbi:MULTISPECIES: TraR/DksA C4-type zinc finger protein [unclassified Thiobacillus]|uniref:TraR/DksA family transcriptional regulator n=1 Tax=unclassified Thiobacillus TaxID=2646513 RepID=UPI000868ACD9|nr:MULTISPECIES: TraR/DksA C4-type zinc finger protein [unclassified Thiobacillus]MBN8781112.1 TraR/DksA C4-type zinc finger protein [Thiobacillus sp.]ODV04615.1 MAG: conjugal transfer protein TraR [Thiobacillus sp. SCN 63-57]OJY57689.1 MAG: conjugal transfer protein TraR [Thiobacillus sp. 0-1251]